jgi:nucleotide-binding universal stress UspA family protein
VAGVDGSPASLAALAFAFEEAALRDVPLVAVCALADAAGRLGEAHVIKAGFGQAMAGQEEEYPEVTVVRKVVTGAPRTSLLTAADGAQMLVVGCRGRGGLDNMALGSVAQAMLHHSPCPVGIAHPAS